MATPARVVGNNVNGVNAVIDFDAGTWFATNVPIDPTIRTIEVTAADALGNTSTPISIPIGFPEYAQYTGAESGIGDGDVVTLSIHPADLNGDGLIDIVELNNEGGRCLLQQSDLTFSDVSAEECGLPTMTGYLCSQMGDLDGDGRLDLIYFTSESAGLLLGGGDGTFMESEVSMIVDGTITDCQLVDIDRNGRLDVVVTAPKT